ncbi:thioredoxin domain-containing protein [Lasioglossum baleicum]|uniref:thioredoxin domain-containing protein n=1 Tax=Lasioglossum baleicum TaxID=434251 RepID=UPI003FCECD72
MLGIVYFLMICSLTVVHSNDLQTVSDTELTDLLMNVKYVVVLFTTKDCEKCDELRNHVVDLKKDLVDNLEAWVVVAEDSKLMKILIPGDEPALVFFRHGIPLLYDGPSDPSEILHMFMENKEPATKQLTDDTFEHLTQASSGATTGDWFVMFYNTDNWESTKMSTTWETVGAKLKHRVNVARIAKLTSGAATARRFRVQETPAFIFFRHGKMYRYDIPKHDTNAFVLFAKEWYKNARAEPVPLPQTPFDDLVEMIANTLRDNPWIMKLGSITIGVFIIISIASKFRRKPEEPQKKD